MAEANLTKSANITVTPREIDFTERFTKNWEHLRTIMGIMRPIRKQPGTILKYKKAKVTLANGNVGEGEKIPYSESTVTETKYGELGVEKYAKAVSLEAIKDHGYDVAVQMTDDEFLFELTTKVTDKFYSFLNKGTLVSKEKSWQRALAMSKGNVVNKFKQMHRTTTNIVGFANVLDLYDWIGDKDITIQSEFGFNYIKNFMGFGTVFLLSDDEIKRGRVIATPVENIINYYVDPSDSDFSRAGLQYVTSGETSLIGFKTVGNYSTAVSESYAILGMELFAEYIDAIAVIDVDEAGNMLDPTIATVRPQTDVTFGKRVSDLVTPDTYLGTDNKIHGTVKKVEGYTEFSGDKSEQNGHYIPIKLASEYEGKEITCVGSDSKPKKAVDTQWTLRLDKLDGDSKSITFKDGETEIMKIVGADEGVLEGGAVK